MNKRLLKLFEKFNIDPTNPPQNGSWNEFLDALNHQISNLEQDRYFLENALNKAYQELKAKEELNEDMTKQLIQSNRLASIGTLAAGIAHELNNPLTAIKGYSEILLKNTEAHDVKNFRFAEKIGKASERMASIIRSMLRLSRKSKSDEFARINIVNVIEETLDFTGQLFKNDEIDIRVKVESSLSPYVYANSSKLISVFQNLLVNSRDAFWDNKIKDSKRISILVECDEDQVRITYSDNAGGIPENVVEQIFDPFFTTKAVGSGTGLGLSISQKIVDEHKGDIKVSPLKGGTQFKLNFPYSKVSSNKGLIPTVFSGSEAEQFDASLENQMKVLVVDDEESICEIFEYTLQPQMDVTTTTEPLKALEILKSQKFDLIITDVKMPGASGIDILKAVRAIDSNLKVILISGNSSSTIVDEIKAYQPTLFINKPFHSISSLKERIINYSNEDLDSIEELAS